jgi:hypothetical protein
MHRRAFFGLIAAALGMRSTAHGGIVPRGMRAIIHAPESILSPKIVARAMEIRYTAFDRQTGAECTFTARWELEIGDIIAIESVSDSAGNVWQVSRIDTHFNLVPSPESPRGDGEYSIAGNAEPSGSLAGNAVPISARYRIARLADISDRCE